MPFVPVPEAVEARLHFTFNGREEAVNVLHFRKSVDVGDTLPMHAAFSEALADKIHTAYNDNINGDIRWKDYVFEDISVRDIDDVDAPSFLFPYGDKDATGAVSLVAPQVALVATLYTAVGGRGGRGRCYIGGIGQLAPDVDSTISAGYRTQVKGFFDDLMSFDIDDGGLDPNTMHMHLGVVSRYAHVGGDPLGDPIPPVVRDVDHVKIDSLLDTQRRRAFKV